MKLISTLFTVALLCGSAIESQAQTVTPFTLVGPIEGFALTGSGPNRGGTIKVHGVTATIPANLIVQMPAAYKTPLEIFDENPSDPGIASGLSIDDAKPPVAAFEATVIGNIVGNTHVAGLVYITQNGLANGAGYVKSIDPASGMMRVGSDPTTPITPTDAFVMLNDVGGVYSPALTPAQKTAFNVDERFTVDTENPTVHAETGYPMCVPGTENAARCLAGNRPTDGTGVALRRFMMDENDRLPAGFATPAGEIVPTCQKSAGVACDSNFEAPIAVGDYINYAGTLTKSASGTIYISAHTVIAAVGIYTQPANVALDPAKPMRAYTALEVSLIGTMGPPIVNPSDPVGRFIPMEAQDRLKIEGTSTDPSRRVEVYAIDVNPADGSKILRLIAKTSPPSAVPVGRYRLTIGARARALYDDFFTSGNPANTLKGAPRELLVRIQDTSGTDMDKLPLIEAATAPAAALSANGLVAGQYVAPVGEFIFPENTGFGDPLVPANFECLSFLVLGSSPTVGQLNPWPGVTPAVFGCGPDPKP